MAVAIRPRQPVQLQALLSLRQHRQHRLAEDVIQILLACLYIVICEAAINNLLAELETIIIVDEISTVGYMVSCICFGSF